MGMKNQRQTGRPLKSYDIWPWKTIQSWNIIDAKLFYLYIIKIWLDVYRQQEVTTDELEKTKHYINWIETWAADVFGNNIECLLIHWRGKFDSTLLKVINAPFSTVIYQILQNWHSYLIKNKGAILSSKYGFTENTAPIKVSITMEKIKEKVRI